VKSELGSMQTHTFCMYGGLLEHTGTEVQIPCMFIVCYANMI
jgi:hypothetical protein